MHILLIMAGVAILGLLASGIYAYIHQIKHVEGVFTHESDARIWGMPPNTFVLTMTIAMGCYLLIVLFPYHTIVDRITLSYEKQTTKIDSLANMVERSQCKIHYLDSVQEAQHARILRLEKRPSNHSQAKNTEVVIKNVQIHVDSITGGIAK